MPTPRKSYAQAELSGSLAVNKGRYADRANAPATTGDVGDPPRHFKAAEKALWHLIVSRIPAGVAGSADSFNVEMASQLLHEWRTDRKNMASSDKRLLKDVLADLGLNAQARTKLHIDEPKEKKPASAIERFNAALPNASDSVQ